MRTGPARPSARHPAREAVDWARTAVGVSAIAASGFDPGTVSRARPEAVACARARVPALPTPPPSSRASALAPGATSADDAPRRRRFRRAAHWPRADASRRPLPHPASSRSPAAPPTAKSSRGDPRPARVGRKQLEVRFSDSERTNASGQRPFAVFNSRMRSLKRYDEEPWSRSSPQPTRCPRPLIP
jgi:hypothetical protein